MKKAVSERVSKAVVVAVCLGNSIGTCDSKTARNGALFSSVMSAGSCVCCDELALVEMVGGCKTAALGVVALA